MSPAAHEGRDGRFKDRSGAAGAFFIALFVALVLWLLMATPLSTGGGSGAGEGGGRGGGRGGGLGDGQGVEIAGGSGAVDGSGTGSGTGSGQSGELADAAQARDDAPAAEQPAEPGPPARPPLRVGFTAAEEKILPPTPPVPVAPTPTTASRPSSAPSGGTPGGAGGGGGGDETPEFMGVKGRGKRVVYVIDRSGSMMANDRLKHACYELKRSIRSLPEDGWFFVIFFDTESLPMPAEKLVRASRQNIDRYSRWIDQQGPGGGTDPSDAMEHALALGPDTVFLMSDGIFPEIVAGHIRAANTRNASVCTVAFHDPIGEPLLKRIAQENEGSFRFVPPP